MSSLAGRTVVVTRAVRQAGDFVARLSDAGAQVIPFPTIEIVEPDSWAACDAALEHLEVYDWLIFSSVNGVERFLSRLRQHGLDLAALSGCKVAAVGSTTERVLRDSGLDVAVTPEKFNAEFLVKQFEKLDIAGRRILLISPQKSRGLLPRSLEGMGAKVDSVPVYKNRAVSADEVDSAPLLAEDFVPDVLTFTSPSTFLRLLELVSEARFRKWRQAGAVVAAIGAVTKNAIERSGYRADIVPAESTIPAFVQSILDYFDHDR